MVQPNNVEFCVLETLLAFPRSCKVTATVQNVVSVFEEEKRRKGSTHHTNFLFFDQKSSNLPELYHRPFKCYIFKSLKWKATRHSVWEENSGLGASAIKLLLLTTS